MKLDEKTIIGTIKRNVSNSIYRKRFMYYFQDDEEAKKMWEASKSYKEFESNVLNDFLKNRSIGIWMYSFISEYGSDSLNNWYRVRRLFDNVIKTYSDVGSLKVGTNGMNVFIHNDYGDGVTRLAIIKKGHENYGYITRMMRNTNIDISGDINIYDYDCGDKIVTKISGSYTVYVYDGMIAFVEL